MSIEEFFEACKHYDWYVIYSDDFRYEQAANERMKKLQAVAITNPVLARILDDWFNYKFSGPNFSTPRLPEPELKNYQEEIK